MARPLVRRLTAHPPREDTMDIRPMTIADYPAVHRLWSGTAGVGMRSLDDSKAGIARFLARNPTTSFVAVENGRVVGAILAGHDGRRGYLYHATVHADRRGRGIGKALVEAVCRALRDEGIHKAGLVVFRANADGQAFWRALGWEERRDLAYYNLSLNDENV
jgi:ribosomal protein S18 acetylase RimI-like enzyme